MPFQIVGNEAIVGEHTFDGSLPFITVVGESHGSFVQRQLRIDFGGGIEASIIWSSYSYSSMRNGGGSISDVSETAEMAWVINGDVQEPEGWLTDAEVIERLRDASPSRWNRG